MVINSLKIFKKIKIRQKIRINPKIKTKSPQTITKTWLELLTNLLTTLRLIIIIAACT